MRTSILFAFVAVAFAAALAAPAVHSPVAAPQHSHHAVKQVQPAIRQLLAALPRDWLSDLIDAITGSDVVALLQQINTTLVGLDRLFKQAEQELEQILVHVSAEAAAEIQAVLDDAVRQAVEIIEPILGQLGLVMPVISKSAGSSPADISSIISAILGKSLEDFLGSIKDAFVQLEQLITDTSSRLQRIASSAAQSASAQIQAVIDNTLAEAKVLIQPLLDILGQIFPGTGNKLVLRQHRDLISDVIEIIEALLGVDIGAIVAQIPLTVAGVEAALEKAVASIAAVVEAEAPAVVERLNAIVAQAVARAQEILQPLLDVLAPVLGGGSRHLPKDLISDLVEIILGVTLEELVALVNDTAAQLDALVQSTLAEVQQVANEVSAEVGQQAQAIVAEAVTEIETAVRPLLDLLAPLLPPPTNTVSVRKMNKGLIEDAIQIIGALLGIDIGAIVAQIPVTVSGVERELTEAVNELVALLASTDASVEQRLTDLVNQAVARAEEIVQPLLDVLAPLIPSGRQVAILPKDLIDDLLQIILGLTLQELVTLVETTFTQLEQLVAETVAEIQRIASEVSAELVSEVTAIVDRTVADVQAEIQPLLDLLAPILPPPTKALTHQHRDLISDVIEIIEALLGVDIGAIVAQIPLTVAGVEAALEQAVASIAAVVEAEAPAVVERLNAIVAQAVARAQEILQPLLDVLAPVLGGGRRHLPKDLISDLVEIILGVTLEELVALVNDTAAQLDALVQSTLAEVQQVANEVSAEVGQQAQVIVADAVSQIQAAVQPLLDLLAPLLPPPTNTVSIRKMNKGLIEDAIQIIGALLGIDIGAIVAQIPVTVSGVERELTEAVNELVALLASTDASVEQRLTDLVNQAAARAQEIVQPLLDVLAPLIPSGRQVALLPKDLIDDLLQIILGLTLQELVTLVETTFTQLEQLVAETVAEIQRIASEVSAELVSEVTAIVDQTVADVQAEIQPLLDLLAPILPPPTKALTHQHRDLISDVIEIIEALLGVDIGAIVAQIPLTVSGVEAALEQAVASIAAVVEAEAPAVVERLNAIVAQAVARAQEILQPLLDVLAPVLGGGSRHLPKDLISDLVEIILGVTLEELVALVNDTAAQLDALVQSTLAEVQQVANEVSAEVGQQAQVIVADAVSAIQAAVQPLLDLLAPLLPPPTNTVSIRKMNKGLIEDAIQIIGALLGIDIGAIVAQIPVTVSGVERVLTEGVNELVALLASTDASVEQRLTDLVNQAVARAEEILQPLLDVLAPLIPSGRKVALLPKDLLDDLLQIILGLTLQELVALVESTVTQLEQLVAETVAEIQRLASDVSAELVSEVTAIVDRTVANVQAEIQPLLDLLAPILPPPTKALAPKDPIQDLIDIIDAVLGIDTRAILAQLDITLEQVVAALDAAAVELEALFAAADSDLNEQVNVVVAQAAARAQEILQPLLDVLQPILGGGARHLSKDIIGDLIEALLGITLAELIELTTTTLIQLEALLNETLDEIARIASEVNAELDAQVQAVLDRTLAQVEAALQPLLDLLAPLLPGGGSKIAIHNQHRDLISDLIDLIGQQLGVDLGAILAQAKLSAEGIEQALVLADSELATLLAGSGVEADVNDILAKAQKEALDILQPLLDVLAPIIGGGSKSQIKAVSSKGLIDDLLGLSLEELIALVESTVSQLEALGLRTVSEIQQVILGNTQLVDEARRILRSLILEINAQLAPLLELLEPLIPSSRHQQVLKIKAH